ncbi:hypothetical protein QBC43DRAFT_343802 [Cladorrhinum sp. PSN259]|nr:hypothetical protein QBC43DRAFT_343802 [Cladorrhinum sp. PSN259]
MEQDDHGRLNLRALDNLTLETNYDKLEQGVETGVRLLKETKAAFLSAHEVPEIHSWIKSIDDLEAQGKKGTTVVGVVGSTGAGKSSVINAVLDQESLLPTNCMRACTAVITEISYNDSDDPNSLYRAEIHFINSNEWARELQILQADIHSGSLVGSDDHTADSDAGVAYHKMRSVYPSLRAEDIKKGNFVIRDLLEFTDVKDLLGSVKQIIGASATEFAETLRTFIDSKEKGRGRKKEEESMEYWPLIKVIKIFVKSQTLESGLVLVDLPGVQDSNAARSAVASKYIEQCSGLWVIAPITRAVDDQAAKVLIGKSFKQQLQFDGTYSTISVICSKTDDITISEILKAMPEDEPAHALFDQSEACQKKLEKLQNEAQETQVRVEGLTARIGEVEKEIACLQSAICYHDPEGGDALTLSSPRKRPARAAAEESRKRLRRMTDSDSSSSSEDELQASDAELEKEQLSLEAAKQRLSVLQVELGRLQTEREEPSKLQKSQKKDIKVVKRDIKRLKQHTRSACIKYRNEYSRPAIQTQFANGIREIDVDNAAQDPDSFDPQYAERDYEQIAQKLPVFCVSSKAYQKLSGRLEKDDPIAGFFNLGDTEMPALMEHARHIVAETHAAAFRRFLRDLCRFFNSLHMQVVIADKPLKLADDLREKEVEALEKAMEKLRRGISDEIDVAFDGLRDVLHRKIFLRLTAAANVASEASVATVERWVAKKSDGGLPFTTFRATCVRDGVFRGSRGPKNFNEELAAPMMGMMAPPWEEIFTNFVPKFLSALGADMAKHLEAFRKYANERKQLQTSPTFKLVQRQVKLLEASLRECAELAMQVAAGQKEANRLIVPTIGNRMSPAYSFCLEQSGEGCFTIMREHMNTHIHNIRDAMFFDAAVVVENSITALVDDLFVQFKKKASRTTNKVEEDYKALLANQHIFAALATSRDTVRSLLSRVDECFDRIVRPPVVVPLVLPMQTPQPAATGVASAYRPAASGQITIKLEDDDSDCAMQMD